MAGTVEVKPLRPERCGNCRYYVRGYGGGKGHCHRFPPSHWPEPNSWPAVDATEWCGEHQKKESDER